MNDAEIRHRLTQAMPLITDVEVEAALTRARARAAQRRRQRRWVAVVAPIAAAALTAAILVLALLPNSSTSRRTPPAHTPTPTSTPQLGNGQWYRHVTGTVTTPSGTVQLYGVWVIRLTSATRGVIQIHPKSAFGNGVLRYDRATRTWIVSGVGKYCGNRSGRYVIKQNGGALTFTSVRDRCAVRSTVLVNNLWTQLTDPSQLAG